MKVVLNKVHPNPPTIRQSLPARDWMNDTHKKHVYKCLPLTGANVHGWEVVLQQDVVVQWDGEHTIPRVLSGEMMDHSFELNGATHEYEQRVVLPSIVGVISFPIGWTVNTPPGYSTWISGSPNYFMTGAEAMTATIPTSWWPDEWNMNWKITKENAPITFPKGMPIMFFQIYEDSLLESIEFDTKNLWDQPELIESRKKYGNKKQKNNVENPWTWTGGIRTGLDADGERIGPAHAGYPVLDVPK
jgi:hypothetical protein